MWMRQDRLKASTNYGRLYFISHQLGQDVEPRLYQQIGGKPSVTMMYRSSDAIDQASKDRYRRFLAAKVKQPEPTANDEEKNPVTANGFYELASTWLRENTRDTKKFPILFSELVTYGFRSARSEETSSRTQCIGRSDLRRRALVSLTVQHER